LFPRNPRIALGTKHDGSHPHQYVENGEKNFEVDRVYRRGIFGDVKVTVFDYIFQPLSLI
jgi:hypothetical protein